MHSCATLVAKELISALFLVTKESRIKHANNAHLTNQFKLLFSHRRFEWRVQHNGPLSAWENARYWVRLHYAQSHGWCGELWLLLTYSSAPENEWEPVKKVWALNHLPKSLREMLSLRFLQSFPGGESSVHASADREALVWTWQKDEMAVWFIHTPSIMNNAIRLGRKLFRLNHHIPPQYTLLSFRSLEKQLDFCCIII